MPIDLHAIARIFDDETGARQDATPLAEATGRSESRLIAAAFEGKEQDNLMLAPTFIEPMQKGSTALRRVVAQAVLAGLPMPALSSALSYFDSYRRARGTANLIQAQRDFFGAHGFKRLDKEGDFHGPWSNSD